MPLVALRDKHHCAVTCLIGINVHAPADSSKLVLQSDAFAMMVHLTAAAAATVAVYRAYLKRWLLVNLDRHPHEGIQAHLGYCWCQLVGTRCTQQSCSGALQDGGLGGPAP
jgi:hypothetical protein